MLASEIQKFIAFCKEKQPQPQSNIKKFFESVILFPYDKELLLQSYLYLNIENIFPSCRELLLFEKAPNGINTNQGKCDFVYLTVENNILLIETKFIRIKNNMTKTEKTRKTSHRSKVIEQVFLLKDKFSIEHNVQKTKLYCGIFTTDPHITQRANEFGILADFISSDSLEQWQKQQESNLLL